MVSAAAIDHVRQLYIKSDHIVFDLIPPSLNTFIERCYHQLGCPTVGRSSAWPIYCDILGLVRQCEGIPAILMGMSDHNVADDELHLLPGLQDLHETDGYMGGIAYGMGLRKFICLIYYTFTDLTSFQRASIYRQWMHYLTRSLMAPSTT